MGIIRKKLALYYHALSMVSSYPVEWKKKPAIFIDYLSLEKKKGLCIDEYNEFEFEKRSDKFREEFLGLNEQRIYLDFLNPARYYSLCRNKYLTHKILENTGIRKSLLYCYYSVEGSFQNSDECASDIKGVMRILNSKGVHSCVIKTTESSHGDNVWVIKDIVYEQDDATLTRFDGKQLLLSSILGSDSLVFESVIHQTKQFASFNESSVNTVRFMTTLWPDGSARIIATFIKIGRTGKCVDNAGGGGNVDVCVDTETGEIKYAIQYDGWHKIKDIDVHPDSGNQLNGVIIENWDTIKKDVIGFQQAFPFCKAIGWDIAITDDGPVVIEANDFWDRTGQYFIRRGWRNAIHECYSAWKKTGANYDIAPRFWESYDKKRFEKLFEYN
jgi:hypothetical protein